MSPITYKCCRNKELQNYCCVSCNNIFHKSCIERKNVIIIESHKIYCSKKCEEKNAESEISSLKLTIDQLNLEIMERDNYIKTQKQASQIFEDDVIEIENHYNIQIKNQQEKIKVLEDKLLENNNKKIEDDIAACLNCENIMKDCKDFKIKLKKLDALNNGLQKKLEIHEINNNKLKDKIKQLKNAQSQGDKNTKNTENQNKANDNVVQTATHLKINDEITHIDTDIIVVEDNAETTQDNVHTHQECQKAPINVNLNNMKNNETHTGSSRKMLLLCDEHGQDLGRQLLKYFNKSLLMVQSIVKPGASFSGVIEDIESLTKNFTLLDYVVIIAGSNDFLNRTYPLFRIINQKIKQCTHTNIIFTTVPFNGNKKLNHFIYKFNIRLSEYVFKLNKYSEGNIQLIDLNNTKGYKKNNSVVLQNIEEIFLEQKKANNNKNLLFINTRKADNQKSRNVFLETRLPQEENLVLT